MSETESTSSTKKPPPEWEREKGDHILDPDGWRHHFTVNGREYSPQGFNDPVTEEEYTDRRNQSTVEMRVSRRPTVTDHFAVNDTTDPDELKEWLSKYPGKSFVNTGHSGLFVRATHELFQASYRGFQANIGDCISVIEGKMYVCHQDVCRTCNPREGK